METVHRKVNGTLELSFDKDATKQLDEAIDKLIKLGNKDDKASIDVYGETLPIAYGFMKRIDSALDADQIKLTLWEKRAFKLAGEMFLDAGSLPVPLGRISSAADEKYAMGFSGVTLCFNLLETRGLVKDMTHKERDALIQATNPGREIKTDPETSEARTGLITLTEKGKLFYSRHCLTSSEEI